MDASPPAPAARADDLLAAHARRPLAPRRRVAPVLDGALEWAVASFALWTVVYHVAAATGLNGGVAWGLALVGAVVLAVVRVRLRHVLRRGYPRAADGVAAVVALGFGVLSLVMVRPDLDDASYMVRARWIQDHAILAPGDVIFSDGRWGGLVGQTPYLASFEAMLGMAARTVGVPVGTLTYLVFLPVAAVASVWALWTLLRAWRVRRPLPALLLACVFLLWGGANHASWGNLGPGRLWQGKIVLLAVVVPLTLAWSARYWATRGARRTAALVLVGAAAVAGVGLSPAGVFVVPGLVAVGAVLGLVTRRVLPAVLLVAVGAAYPLGAGLVTRFLGNLSDSTTPIASVGSPVWQRTLGTGLPAWVAFAAGAVALLGLVPALARTYGRIGALTAAAAVLAGALITVPPVWDAAVRVMGTDAIAWRLAWIVPVPALVGMLASPMRRGPRAVGLVGGLVAAVLLVVGGVPVWSASNVVPATVVRSPVWKQPPNDLATARWIVAHPPEGRYAAPQWVGVGVGTSTSALSPVGSRPDYLASYADLPEAQVPDRQAVQNWVDGIASADDLARVPAALDSLDVGMVCGPHDLAGVPAGWQEAFVGSTQSCWVRR